jgi:hypothetical protein
MTRALAKTHAAVRCDCAASPVPAGVCLHPNPPDQPIRRHKPAGVHRQRRQDTPLPGRPEVHRPPIDLRGYLALTERSPPPSRLPLA